MTEVEEKTVADKTKTDETADTICEAIVIVSKN